MPCWCMLGHFGTCCPCLSLFVHVGSCWGQCCSTFFHVCTCWLMLCCCVSQCFMWLLSRRLLRRKSNNKQSDRIWDNLISYKSNCNKNKFSNIASKIICLCFIFLKFMNTFVQDHHSLAAHGDQVGEGQGKAHHTHHIHQHQMGSHSQYLLTQGSKEGSIYWQ